MAALIGNPRPQFFTNDNPAQPASGYYLYFYENGDTSTKRDTFEGVGGAANPNPIILDSSGRPDNAGTPIDIALLGTYTVVLALSTDTDPPAAPIWTVDDVVDISQLITEWIKALTATRTSATTFTLVGDQTADYKPGRRGKGEGGADRFWTIDTSVFTTLTTITVKNTVTGASPPVASTLHASMNTAYVNINSPRERTLTASVPFNTFDYDSNRVINAVVDFNVPTDGVTATSSAIQAAGDAAHALGGAIVEFPVGAYFIDTPIIYTGWRGVIFRGIGAEPMAYGSADAAGGGPINSGKSVEFITTTAIAAMYGTQGGAADRTRRLVVDGIHFTGNDATLGSGNYGIHWHQDNAAVFSGNVTIKNCNFIGFENGVRVTTASGSQATGLWRIIECGMQQGYWGIYAPGGINQLTVEGGTYGQNNNVAASANIVSEDLGGGMYIRATALNIRDVDVTACSTGIRLESTNGFTIDSYYEEASANAQLVINNSRDGTVNSPYSLNELIVQDCQAVTIHGADRFTVRVVGQCRDLKHGPNVVYDSVGGLTANNKNISVYTEHTNEARPTAVGNLDNLSIVTNAGGTFGTIDTASTDFPSPWGGPVCTKLVSTGASQYYRVTGASSAFAVDQYVNCIMYMYVPTALTGTLSINVLGSAGSQVSANLNYFPRDTWFSVKTHIKADAISTSVDFRVTCSITGQTFYVYKPTVFIADTDIEPFVTNAIPGVKDGPIEDWTAFPGNSIQIGAVNITVGSGTPEAVLTGRRGDLFLRDDGGAGTSMYVKETGTGNTGWVGK